MYTLPPTSTSKAALGINSHDKSPRPPTTRVQATPHLPNTELQIRWSHIACVEQARAHLKKSCRQIPRYIDVASGIYVLPLNKAVPSVEKGIISLTDRVRP